MTRIRIEKTKNGNYQRVTCKGHTGYAEAGEDIVCSAISVLIINTVNSLNTLTKTPFDMRTDERCGLIDFWFMKEPDAGGKLLLDSMVLGLSLIHI